MNIGDTIIVRGGFGREAPQEVEVNDLGEKNGRTVIHYIDKNGDGRWCYPDQVERVVAKAN